MQNLSLLVALILLRHFPLSPSNTCERPRSGPKQPLFVFSTLTNWPHPLGRVAGKRSARILELHQLPSPPDISLTSRRAHTLHNGRGRDAEMWADYNEKGRKLERDEKEVRAKQTSQGCFFLFLCLLPLLFNRSLHFHVELATWSVAAWRPQPTL